MATASLTTSPTQIDSGAADNVSITNTGATDVTIVRGPQSFTLRPTQTRVIYPEGAAVTAATASGAGSVSYAATAARTSAAQQYAADAAFTGTYAPIGMDRASVSAVDRNTTALRYFRQALALRNTARCDIAIVPGDSLTEGQGTTTITNRWSDRLRDILRTRFPTTGVTGGYGYVAARSIVTSSTYPLVTLAGTPTPPGAQYGYGRRSAQVQNGTQTITLNSIAATEIDLYYTDGGGGTFAWAVDGGSTTNVATTGTVGPKKIRVLSSGGGTTHTVVVSWVSGNGIINGFDVFNGDATKGIRVHNGGFNGSKAADWLPLHTSQNYWADHLASTLLNPSLVLIPIGANEFKTADSVSTYQTNLASIIASVRTYAPLASICLVVEHELGGVTVVNPWSQYAAANYAVATADGNVAVFDLWQRLGPTPAAETHGVILSSDHQHYTDEGNLFVADALAGFLAP